MLRLTKLTDYGILLMTHMASSKAELHSAGGLAEATHVPLPTVSKILQMLLHQGLLESIRGPRGGYQLARSADRISVREIIHTFEGSIALTECNLEDGECEQSAVCSTSNNWKRINLAVSQALESISLADMTQQDFMPVFRLQRAIGLTAVQS
ncbi:MAG TPA: SUF system Fe-S cluster assembly regulator [Mariprofundaceae bacterium]|nr:SUF system Fe-S cluster assembly regulator [Mariprofundaceae bacterium]